MNPNLSETHDCPYHHSAEKSRLKDLVDSMNALIRHHRSLAGAETREDFVKGLQKLLFRSGLPKDIQNRLQPFYLSAQLKAAQQDEWFDSQSMDDAFREAMEACLEPDVREKLQDLAAKNRALICQRLKTETALLPEEQLEKDLHTVNDANPVHWRVRNFFRHMIREGIPEKPLDFKALLKELEKDWEEREEKAREKTAERRQQAEKTLSSIRADVKLERHIRETLKGEPVPEEEPLSTMARMEEVLIDNGGRPLSAAPVPASPPAEKAAGAQETPPSSKTEEESVAPLGIDKHEFNAAIREDLSATPDKELPEVSETPAETANRLLSRPLSELKGVEKQEWNKLMWAAFSGNKNSVRRFLEQGLNADEADPTGCTPLMLAAENGFSHIVQILIDHKADWKKKDKKGENALDKARRVGHEEVIAALESFESETDFAREPVRFPEHEAAQKFTEIKEAGTAEQAFEWGNDASRNGNYKLARQYFEQAITIDSNFALAYRHLGYVLEQLGELDLSADYHRTATEMEARSLITSARQAVQMGDDFNNQNNLEKALECYQKVFTYGFNPTPDVVARAYFGMGQVYLKKNELEPAKDHFKKAFKLEPNHFDSCRYLGYIFHREDNLEAAVIWYNKALKIRPDHEWVSDHLRAIQVKRVPSSSSGDSLEEAFADLAVQQKQEEADFQVQMASIDIQLPEDIQGDSAGSEAEPYHVPDTGQLNGIGVPVKPDGMPPPPIYPDAADLNKDVFGFISPAVRGQNQQLSEEKLEQKRIRAKKRLDELCRVIACEEHRTAEELEEAVHGYVALVRQPRLSCIKGVDHRAIGVKLRDLWKAGVLEDFTPVDMAHAQDLAVSSKLSGLKSEDYFKALAEYGKSCFELRTIEGSKRAVVFFFKALKINPKPKGEYQWIREWMYEAQKRLDRLEKEAKEQPVKVEEGFEKTLHPPTIVNADMPEAVRDEAQEGMGIFKSRTRKFIPETTKVKPKEPRTIPRGKVLQQHLKEQMGDISDEPVTQRDIRIPKEARDPSRKKSEFDDGPPTIPTQPMVDDVLKGAEKATSGPEVTDNPEFRRKAQELRRQHMESDDAAHQKMLQTTIYKYHYDDINFHRRKSAVAYLELGISLIAFKDKPRAARALKEAQKLVRADQQTLKEQIHEWLGKLNEKAV